MSNLYPRAVSCLLLLVALLASSMLPAQDLNRLIPGVGLDYIAYKPKPYDPANIYLVSGNGSAATITMSNLYGEAQGFHFDGQRVTAVDHSAFIYQSLGDRRAYGRYHLFNSNGEVLIELDMQTGAARHVATADTWPSQWTALKQGAASVGCVTCSMTNLTSATYCQVLTSCSSLICATVSSRKRCTFKSKIDA